MKMRCCFAGHSNASNSNVKSAIRQAIIELIEEEKVTDFWVGNYGGFDRCVLSVLRELKKSYKDAIKIELVIPYLKKDITLSSDLYKECDTILLAEIDERTPKKFYISKTNEYMILTVMQSNIRV